MLFGDLSADQEKVYVEVIFFAYHPNCLAQEFRENVLHFVICNYFMPEQSIDQNIFPEVQEQLSGFYPPAPKVNDRGH